MKYTGRCTNDFIFCAYLEDAAMAAAVKQLNAEVRKTRSWSNIIPHSLYSHWNAWAKSYLLGQPKT